MSTLRHTGGPWEALHRSPILRVAVPFITGVVLADVMGAGPLAAWGVLLAAPPLLAVLLFPSLPISAGYRGAVLGGWCLCFGVFWTVVHHPDHDPAHVQHHRGEGAWLVAVRNVSGSSDRVVRADATVLGQAHERATVPLRGEVLLTLLTDSAAPLLRAGDRVLVEGMVEPIRRVPDPGGFDRRAWAASRGIGEELFAPAGAWRTVGHRAHWTDIFTTARTAISDWLDGSDLTVQERAVAKALVLGLRDELSREQVDAYARSGTIHLLAVSGMHVGLIYAALKLLFGWLGAAPRARLLRGVLVLLALWGYTGLTGNEPSVLRATVMFSMFTLADMSGRRVEGVNSLGAAALVLMLWDPFMWRMIGFQLSFMAVLGILLLYKPVMRLWQPRGPVLRYAWSMLAVSFVAQLATTPLVLYHFKAFPTWFLPANLVVCAVGTVAIYGSIALIALYKVPLLGAAVTTAMQWLLTVMDRSTVFFAQAPAAYPAVRVDATAMALISVLIAAATAWAIWRWGAMRWAVAAAVAGLIMHWGLQVDRRDRGGAFVVYDDRHRTQAAMATGRELVVLDLGADAGHLPTKLERHARATGVEVHAVVGPEVLSAEVPTRTGATIAGAGRWTAPGMDVLFVSAGSGWPAGTLRPDVMVVHDMQRLRTEDLPAEAVVPERVVLAAGLHWRVRGALKTWCTEREIPWHDVQDQGAFILERPGKSSLRAPVRAGI
ncbi:MAG: ComEC/Rec2 family competence protein [Flavobacteriales bacterium]|jgi:competence protein ComEC|nr:ComEC/Rec2 family competence protein [Flavobacteriales bacterium]